MEKCRDCRPPKPPNVGKYGSPMECLRVDGRHKASINIDNANRLSVLVSFT